MSALQPHLLLSIGDVLNILKPEFGDLTISKLRYLESEGLVEPERTSTGYRKYSHAHVQRLRYVLTQQRDHFLPLRVIKDQLEALDRGLEVSTDLPGRAKAPRALISVDSLPNAADFISAGQLRLTETETLDSAGATKEQLTACREFGLVSADAAYFTSDDVAVLKSVAALETYGIEPRHLRQFKIAADRELGLVEQVVSPLRAHRDPESDHQADEAGRDISALAAGLHIALVRSGLTRMLKHS